jgi:DNA transposition AAA+ family ATPase
MTGELHSERFLETTAARQVKSAIERAIEDGEPSLIMSDPGMGKTTAVKHYAQELGGAYWEVRESEGSIRQMFLSLMNVFHFWHDSTHTNDIAEILYSRLGDGHERKPFLIVDEFQNLELKAFRELLRIGERCGLPLVLSGNDKRLKQTKTGDVALAQIGDRIGVRVSIWPPFPEDCQSLAVEFNVEGKDAY